MVNVEGGVGGHRFDKTVDGVVAMGGGGVFCHIEWEIGIGGGCSMTEPWELSNLLASGARVGERLRGNVMGLVGLVKLDKSYTLEGDLVPIIS